MRSRKTWGTLGSIVGIASSVSLLACSTVFLLATTTPALASPSCLIEQLELGDAEIEEDFRLAIYTLAVFDLAECQMGPGPCLIEELEAGDALINYQASVAIRQIKQFALTMCQSQF